MSFSRHFCAKKPKISPLFGNRTHPCASCCGGASRTREPRHNMPTNAPSPYGHVFASHCSFHSSPIHQSTNPTIRQIPSFCLKTSKPKNTKITKRTHRKNLIMSIKINMIRHFLQNPGRQNEPTNPPISPPQTNKPGLISLRLE